MKTVLITGGTGLIGKRLSYLLTQKGYAIRLLSRTENLGALYPTFGWDLNKMTINETALDGIDAIVNLAGAGIADKRWTTKRKKEIIDSRVLSSQLLYQYLSKMGADKPKVFVACSAVGYYGNCGESVLTEKSKVGDDFMSEVCDKWEKSALPIRDLGIRMPTVRVGVVLSTQGGALTELNQTAPFHIMGYFGLGKRYLSWIHIDDICNIFIAAIENNEMEACYNGTAPNPVNSFGMATALAKVSNKKMLKVPVPPLALKLALGEMSAVVLNSTRAVPQNLERLGFEFKYPNLDLALKNLFDNKI
jgi:uncharacterized protein (TIGR01777 family)